MPPRLCVERRYADRESFEVVHVETHDIAPMNRHRRDQPAAAHRAARDEGAPPGILSRVKPENVPTTPRTTAVAGEKA